MVETVHKNTNAPLILIVCEVIFMRAKHINGYFEGASTFLNDFFGLSLHSEQFWVQKSLGPLENPLKIAA
jgi:hypothetical protein